MKFEVVNNVNIFTRSAPSSTIYATMWTIFLMESTLDTGSCSSTKPTWGCCLGWARALTASRCPCDSCKGTSFSYQIAGNVDDVLARSGCKCFAWRCFVGVPMHPNGEHACVVYTVFMLCTKILEDRKPFDLCFVFGSILKQCMQATDAYVLSTERDCWTPVRTKEGCWTLARTKGEEATKFGDGSSPTPGILLKDPGIL